MKVTFAHQEVFCVAQSEIEVVIPISAMRRRKVRPPALSPQNFGWTTKKRGGGGGGGGGGVGGEGWGGDNLAQLYKPKK